jgi:hypothetical protein
VLPGSGQQSREPDGKSLCEVGTLRKPENKIVKRVLVNKARDIKKDKKK